MTERELRRLLAARGCIEVRQKGSHLRVRCGKCLATIPVHSGVVINKTVLKWIDKQLAPCLGQWWMFK